MSNVVVDRHKIDILANAISGKSGEPVTMTLDEMVEAVDGIEVGGGEPNLQSKTYTVDSAGSETVTADSGYDGLSSVRVSVPSIDPAIESYGTFITESNVRKWSLNVYAETDGESGWFDGTVPHTRTKKYNAVPKNTSVTPTELAQTVGGSDRMMEGSVTVNAIPSDYVGSAIYRRSSSSLERSGNTVTVPNGYYESAASMTVPTSSVSQSTWNPAYSTSNNQRRWRDSVALTRTEGWVSGDATSYHYSSYYNAIPSGTVITPTTSQQTIGGADTMMEGAVTVEAMPSGTAGTPTATKGTVSNHSVSVTPSVTNTTGYIAGSTKTGTAVTVSASELVSGSQTITQNGTVDVTNLAEVVVSVEGGGGGGMTVATATATPSSTSASISFTGLSGDPTSFAVISAADLATGASPYKTAAVVFDGSDLHGQTITNTNNAQVSYDDTHFSKTYSNGTLTITGSTYWQANEYTLVYTYGGNSANIGTADVQVGSGATSITFTGLTDEPDYFSCIFKSNFATSSGYQRVIAVVYDGNSTYGLAMDSGAKAESSWSYTYSNGSLTISSQSTSVGGYFHQPGYYQLTYGIGGTVEPTEIEVEPLSVTQNGTYTAPAGKAYSPVTVNVSGGSVNIDTKSMTNSSNQNTSISFSSMKGQPKAFFARCTSSLSRSSSNTYYYVADMVYDGTSTVGNVHARSTGQYSNITSGYSWSYSGTTLTLTSSGARGTSPGSFYNGTYELVYIY